MINLEEHKIRDFLKTKFTCNCGKEHRVDIDNIVIEKEAIAFLPSLINQYNFKKIFIIADVNTYKVAGEITETALQGNGFDLKKYIFEDEEHLIPDEKAIGKLLIQITSDIDLILAIGSGTLNDLSRYLSYKLSIPYFIVVTAPSMDGYASTVSALIVNDLKTTYTAISPKAIIADINIIKNAPMEMITAGLGDILGKYTSLCDWELGRIINGEYYCETVVNIVRNSIQKCVSNIDGIKNRDNFAIKNLMEGLVLTGIAMSFVGNSRPASGSEHHLSHFWEMMFLLKGKKAILHGTKVGIATLIITKLYELLVTKTVNFNNAIDKVNSFNQKEWVKCIEKTYKTAAPDIIALEERAQKNSIEKYNKRIQIIKSKWNDIIRTIKKIVPSAKEIEAILQKVDAPINPLQVGVDSNTILNSIIFAKEIRGRYTVLQLLWDLGLLREFASNINDYFIKEQGYKCLSDKDKAKDILKQVKCFVLDMDGTFYLGDKLYSGSLDFLKCLKKYRKDFYFFTNNSSKNVKYYIEKLKKMGCKIKGDKVLISNQVIIQYIKKHMSDKKVYLLGTDYLKADFINADIEIVEDDPGLVIVGFDTTLEYKRLSKACDFIRNNVPVFAVNPDFNCPTETGFIPDCGSICALITASTGVIPVFFGKPSHYTLQYILDYTKLKDFEIAYVGDRLYTDIAMGDNNKMITILVLTGETKKEDLINSTIKPDLVFESLKEVKSTLDEIY